MRVVKTGLGFDVSDYSDKDRLYIYNGLDTAVTKEVWDRLRARLDDNTLRTYEFTKALRGPAMSMQRRGIRVDQERRDELIAKMGPRIREIGGMEQNQKTRRWEVVDESAPLQQMSLALTGRVLNYESDKQLKKLFYEDLQIPVVRKFDKGKSRVAVDRAALEHIGSLYLRGRAFANAIIEIRDYTKKLSVLRTAGERMYFSFNVSGTETGRWSSKKSVFSVEGTQGQNITEDLRSMFIPDEGYTLIYPDLEQAESRAVAYLSEDEAYINACLSGDLHTIVTQMVWPHLPWDRPGDDVGRPVEKRADGWYVYEGDKWNGPLAWERIVADTKYYRHFSHRDMSKKAGHGSNYGGTPRTLGNQMKVKEKYITRFQLLYFGGQIDKKTLERWGMLEEMAPLASRTRGNVLFFEGAFPKIREWHHNLHNELQQNGELVTPLGRRRMFWDRLSSPQTFREALAYLPQSTIADVLNLGMYKVWQKYEPEQVQLLMQVHDAFVGQVQTDKLEQTLPLILDLMHIPVDVKGRTMIIPAEMLYGKNWSKKGLNKYHG